MFNVGDKVVHPMHGGGVIDSIVSERINGKTQEYYVFHMPLNGLVLKIPVSNAHLVGLRFVSSPAEIAAVMEAIPGLSVSCTSNWNRRYRENMDRLKSGDLMEVVWVIKCLALRESERGLSTGERKLLHSAKQIFISELVLATDEPYQQIETRLQASIHEKGA